METTKKIPITIFAEMTPNPATMKFVADTLLIRDGKVVEFGSKSEAAGYSALAERLFDFPFITNVFIAVNFVTITKNDAVEWDMITLELREFVRDFLMAGGEAVSKVPDVIQKEDSATEESVSHAEPTDDIDKQIIDLLEEYVRPAVENDGGAIHFKSHNEGTVRVVMKGSCSGCPSSTATLKGGIEQLLKTHIPTIKEVVPEEG